MLSTESRKEFSEAQMLFSVVIPAFNAAQFIGNAIRSVLDQTEQSFEVIVVDDCSEDDTSAIAAEIARTDERIKLIRLPANVGPGGARNVAINASQGTWVALLDADDRYHPSRLERLQAVAARTGADIVSDNIMLHQEDGCQPDRVMYSNDRIPCEMRLTPTEFVIQNTRKDNGCRSSFGFMQPIFRREFLLKSGLTYELRNRFGEDFMFSVRCLTEGANWWITPDALYIYTVRQGSLTETATPEDLRVISAMEQELLDEVSASAGTAFATAIKRHKRTVDHWRHTMAFKAALQRQAFREAFTVAFESRSSLQAVLRDLAANTCLKVYRRVSQGWRKT
jgi:glycosyltransferase involved in cell wall biosynthesis